MRSMKVDAAIFDVLGAADEAERIESLGYDGAFSFEGPHDPFLPLLAAAQRTRRIDLYTAVAIGFARNPMLLANLGWDLQAFSKGRFLLGLGTQIRPHVEKRFGMPWSKPAARMRELVLAVREIWRCWAEGGRLDFRGEFYRHTLMTPMFSPGPNPYGNPPILLAGVGPRMTEVAGEVADGFLVHPLHTARSLREITLPALARGREKAGRAEKDLAIACQIMLVTGRDPAEVEASRAAARAQIAFYASTPAYRVVLDVHGLGALQPELNALSKRGAWKEMARLVPDALLEEVAVCCPLEQVAARVRERCGGTASRVSLVAYTLRDPSLWQPVVRELQAGART
jgi:probable F420-dependent oxidoreductase